MSKSVSRIYRHVMKRLKFAAPHIDGFKEWLREAGYRAPTIEELVRLLAGWTDWMSASGFTLARISHASIRIACRYSGFDSEINMLQAFNLRSEGNSLFARRLVNGAACAASA